jgi:hypothetical protein
MFKWLSRFGLIACAVGCSSGSQANYGKLGLVDVSGTVTLDGTPVAGAGVYFHAPDATYCYGMTDASGGYTMMFNSEKSGVIPGEKRVEIFTSRNPLGDMGESGEGEETDPDSHPEGNGEKIPACYNTSSHLKITITGPDSHLDFELKSDCSTSAAD